MKSLKKILVIAIITLLSTVSLTQAMKPGDDPEHELSALKSAQEKATLKEAADFSASGWGKFGSDTISLVRANLEEQGDAEQFNAAVSKHCIADKGATAENLKKAGATVWFVSRPGAKSNSTNGALWMKRDEADTFSMGMAIVPGEKDDTGGLIEETVNSFIKRAASLRQTFKWSITASEPVEYTKALTHPTCKPDYITKDGNLAVRYRYDLEEAHDSLVSFEKDLPHFEALKELFSGGALQKITVGYWWDFTQVDPLKKSDERRFDGYLTALSKFEGYVGRTQMRLYGGLVGEPQSVRKNILRAMLARRSGLTIRWVGRCLGNTAWGGVFYHNAIQKHINKHRTEGDNRVYLSVTASMANPLEYFLGGDFNIAQNLLLRPAMAVALIKLVKDNAEKLKDVGLVVFYGKNYIKFLKPLGFEWWFDFNYRGADVAMMRFIPGEK